ncbi:MAG: response regulator [Thermoplasmata archaeon]|nr:response regulator [Thermoplasmata archaeon]
MTERGPPADREFDIDDFPAPPRSKRDAPSLKILAVENSSSAQRLMQAVLLKLGVALPDLRLATSSSEAMQLFTSWRPDVVFVDLDLGSAYPRTTEPGANGKDVDGDELARQLLSRNPRLNVVVVTAYDRDHPRVKTILAEGARDVIMKPLRAQRVQEALALCATPRVPPAAGAGRPGAPPGMGAPAPRTAAKR